MSAILILKTAALGDVLRTTSILPGLVELYPGREIVWLTSAGARPLVEHHPQVDRVEVVDASDAASVAAARERLVATRWERVLSFDDEEPLCRLASDLDTESLSGAYLDAEGLRVYTADVAPWFDMGLLSVHGKEEADRRKVANVRTHPEIFATMLGVPSGRPQLPLEEPARRFAAALERETELKAAGTVIGLNTGAGGRWLTKGLSEKRTVELARQLAAQLDGAVTFLLLGGEAEAERNRNILAGARSLEPAVRVVDAGTSNPLAEFAALVSLCDLLIVSDSLALHVAIARGVRVVAFFAPTSAAEIELYGLGEKVWSTAPDYCSYGPEADNSTITPERLAAAAARVLAGELA